MLTMAALSGLLFYKEISKLERVKTKEVEPCYDLLTGLLSAHHGRLSVQTYQIKSGLQTRIVMSRILYVQSIYDLDHYTEQYDYDTIRTLVPV